MVKNQNLEDSKTRLWEALKEVEDPEFPVSIVDMGLIREIKISGEIAEIIMTYTSTACPCMDWIEQDIRERLLEENGISEVRIDVVWDSPWTVNDLSQKARTKLKEVGVTT